MQQTIKTRHGRTLIVPTPEEDAAINAGIAADPDTHEVTDAELTRMRRMGEDARALTPHDPVTLRMSCRVIGPQ